MSSVCWPSLAQIRSKKMNILGQKNETTMKLDKRSRTELLYTE